ncbi:glucosamine--fructose-6-phosphate aminotransferase [Clostridia bacterium]|nr:glucosamine--fructose-6-phosphate aminotransferase [Clostridia bacterium]
MNNNTYPEIRSQYTALRDTISYIVSRSAELNDFFSAGSFRRIVVTGCGSSYSVSKSVASSASLSFGMPALAIPAGDLMLHPDTYTHLFDQALLFVITRSGATDEIINVVRQIKETDPDVSVLSVICAKASRLAALSDLTIEIPWAFDESVCQTRSVTNLYAGSLLALVSAFGNDQIKNDLNVLAAQGTAFLDSIETGLKMIVQEGFNSVYVLADAEANGVAEEASLAFTEIAYTPGICKHVLDIRHGPIVLMNEQTLAIVLLNEDGFEYQEALISSLLERGTKVIVYSAEKLPQDISGIRAQIVFGYKLSLAVSALPLLGVAQLLAYHSAISKGLNPDQPDGLDPWIAL